MSSETDFPFNAVAATQAKDGSCPYVALKVESPELERAFLKTPEIIYQHDPSWIPSVNADIISVFDQSKNPYFTHGEAARWVIVDNERRLCGRIAAFINFNKLFEGEQKVGGVGFFECIENVEAAHALFDVAIGWLTERYHIDIVDGPINFGENDKYWGLLIGGKGSVSYGMNYNPPYYLDLFESYGFRILYKQFTNYINLTNPFPDRFVRIATRVGRSNRYEFKPLRYSDRKRFTRDFVHVYNKAWASFKNFHPMDEAVVAKSLDEMRPVAIEDLIWFAYTGGVPIGVLVVIPDVNEIIKYSGSEFNFWGKCKFAFYKYVKGFTTIRVVIMGIVPEFQNHGIESALILHALYEAQKRPRLKHVQLAWVGDFNSKMIAIHNALNAVEDKQHATLRKML